MSSIPSHIQAHVRFLAEQVAPQETDWLAIKKLLLVMLPPRDRKSFTTRDQQTKRHQPFNPFENGVRDLWREITGNTLEMPIDKRMEGIDPAGYL